jgi:hypothetical protein
MTSDEVGRWIVRQNGVAWCSDSPAQRPVYEICEVVEASTAYSLKVLNLSSTDKDLIEQIVREHNSKPLLVDACKAAMDDIGPSEQDADAIDMLRTWRLCKAALATAEVN